MTGMWVWECYFSLLLSPASKDWLLQSCLPLESLSSPLSHLQTADGKYDTSAFPPLALLLCGTRLYPESPLLLSLTPFPLFQTRISFAPQVMPSISEFFGLTTKIWSCKHFLQTSSCLSFTQICQVFFMYCGWGYKCLLVLLKAIYISISYLGLIFFNWEMMSSLF